MTMNKYKLMDRITVYTVDYNKAVTYVPTPKGCSGGISCEINSKDEVFIYKIETTEWEEYSLTDQYDDYGDCILKQGINRERIVKYYITSKEEPLTESALTSMTNENPYNEISYQRHIKNINNE